MWPRHKRVWIGAKDCKNWCLHIVYQDPAGNKYVKRYGDECWHLLPDGVIEGTKVFIWKQYEKETI